MNCDPKKIYNFVSDCEPYYITLSPGNYFIELHGADGGFAYSDAPGGKGGSVSGLLNLKTTQNFFLYIGGKGANGTYGGGQPPASCNGGGRGGKSYHGGFISGGSGGGATDLRLTKSADSRFMVAAGGGGACHSYVGGNGGGLVGSDGVGKKTCQGGTQTSGGKNGIGEDGRNATVDHYYGAEGGGGSGGGYFGGLSYHEGDVGTNTPGSGGSSYVSGAAGCTKRNDIVLKRAKIFAGDSSVSSPYDGNGYAVITLFLIYYPTHYQVFRTTLLLFCYIPFFIK